jgi:hypothetical protein
MAKAYEIGARVERQAAVRSHRPERGGPTVRPLRIYTLDPSVSARLGGIATVLVPYEKLAPGPVGALFEVKCDSPPAPLTAARLDLDHPDLLLSSGLAPTPADGRFHLQMVYAVCSLTYSVFKRALGRDIAWATAPAADGSHRLAVRPFAFRGRNAGFSREAGEIAFGYFRAGAQPAGFTVQKGLVCTALSHDIIAHETTHALLDGLRASFDLPTNVDVPAFHEAFADLVALFLHFSYSEVVEQAIRQGGGDLARGSVLTELAQEFGYARSRAGRARSLRSGIDVENIAAFDSDILPSDSGGPKLYDPRLEPHALGSVLVSAVFEAFTTVFRRRTERFYDIAGVSPQRAPRNEALVRAIANEASDLAGRFLDICIRAIDYCPPADMELGEYLRALITADWEIDQRDKWGFREALMRSFRRRRIFPDHVQFMTEDAVRWQPPAQPLSIPELAFRNLEFNGEPGEPADKEELRRQAEALGRFVTHKRHASAFQLIAPGASLPRRVTQASPPMVQSVRVARRAASDGRILFDLVAEVTQSCTVRVGGDLMDMNGGCTVVIDPEGNVRYIVFKRFGSDTRVARQHGAIRGPLAAFWEKKGKHFVPRPGMLRRLHGLK